MERTNEPSAHQHERDQQESKQPADVIRDGNLKASIWRNEGESGAFYATTFARSWRDENGEYRDGHSFVAADLLKLSELARAAYTRTNELRRDDVAQARGQDGDDARRAEFRQRRQPEKSQDKSKNYEK
tara:strand:- start:30 stop:416 length:387 start_codon:yes stop_codon:yes gene_type:complete